MKPRNGCVQQSRMSRYTTEAQQIATDWLWNCNNKQASAAITPAEKLTIEARYRPKQLIEKKNYHITR